MRRRRWPATPPSEGARLLRELALRATLRALARRALCDDSTLARYATGARVPWPSLRVALEARLGIPASSWGRDASATGAGGRIWPDEPCKDPRVSRRRPPLPAGAPNGGARLLRELAATRTWGQLARRLAVDASTVRRWALGARLPVPDMRERIEAVLGIPWGSWDDATEAALGVPGRNVYRP